MLCLLPCPLHQATLALECVLSQNGTDERCGRLLQHLLLSKGHSPGIFARLAPVSLLPNLRCLENCSYNLVRFPFSPRCCGYFDALLGEVQQLGKNAFAVAHDARAVCLLLLRFVRNQTENSSDFLFQVYGNLNDVGDKFAEKNLSLTASGC